MQIFWYIVGTLTFFAFCSKCAIINAYEAQQKNMQQLSVREMRQSIGKLDQLVKHAGEIIVTRNGKAIARVLPIKGSRPRPSHSDLRRSLPKSESDAASLIRADRDER